MIWVESLKIFDFAFFLLASGDLARFIYQFPIIIRFMNLHKKDLVLDVGCGWGMYSLPLSEWGVNTVSLDINKESLRALKEKALK